MGDGPECRDVFISVSHTLHLLQVPSVVSFKINIQNQLGFCWEVTLSSVRFLECEEENFLLSMKLWSFLCNVVATFLTCLGD